MNPKSGQVGIILLLVTVVMLTVGTSAVSRSTVDIRSSRVSEDANRTLDAAESGIEEAFEAISDGQVTQPTNFNTSPNAGITVITNANAQTTLEAFMDQGEVVQIDLAGTPVGRTLTFHWGRESNCNNHASLIIIVFKSSGTGAIAERQFIGNRCGNRNALDGFTQASVGTASGFNLRTTYQTEANDLFIRIRPLYFATNLQVTGATRAQMFTALSTGQSTTNLETKAIEAGRTLPVAPAVLDYVLFSGRGITQ